jgi:glycosyltransferase involved in cell wall biosynthesis
MRDINILLISGSYDPDSGWGRYGFEIKKELERRGVSFVALSRFLKFSPINLLRNILLVRKNISENTTIIHCLDVWPFAVYAYFANMGIGKPLFVSGVGTYSVPPKHGLKAYLMRKALKKAREVFCISNYTLKKIKDRCEKAHLTFVPLGTSQLPLVSEESEDGFLYRYGISSYKSPLIATVGQIKHRKGQFDTLKALNILKAKYPGITYLVAGSTVDQRYVKALKEYVDTNRMGENLLIMDDLKTDEELAELYSACDVLVLNSNNDRGHFEGFGLVILEAAQFAKPAVGSSGCGIEDAIEDGVTGYLSKQGDEKDIAEKIKLVLENKEKMGFSAQKRATSFTWEATVDRYLSSYKNSI